MKREIKTTLALDGEQRFKQELQAAAREMRVLKTETRANTLSFGENAKSVEALTQRNQGLTKQANQQREIIRSLTRAVEESAEKYGEADKRTDGYRIRLSNAQAALSQIENEIRQNNKAISEQTDWWKKAGEAAEKAGKKITEAGKGMTKVGDALTKGVTLPLTALGTAAFLMAADLEDAIGASEQVFGSASESMQKWVDKLESYYGIAKAEAYSYANTMGSMLQNIGGLTEEEAARQAQVLIELAGDLTAMFGGRIEDAIRALTGALKGNNTMLDNYGMAVNDALIKTRALELGLMNEGEQLSLAAKQTATLSLIMEQTAAAQGQAAREADGASGSLRALKVEAQNAMVVFGRELLPMGTALVNKAKDLAEWIGNLDDETKEQIVTMGLYAVAVGPVISGVGRLTTNVGGAVTQFSKLSKAISNAGGIAAVMSGPVGWAVLGAVAIGGLALAVADGAREVRELTKDARALDSAMDDATSTFDKAKDTFSKTTAEVEASVSLAQSYIGKLKELEQAGLDTVESQNEYARVVEILRQLIPDVNIELDAQTGKIVGGTQALWENTQAWRENAIAQALQAQITEQLEAYTAAMLELTIAENELSNQQDTLASKTQQMDRLFGQMLNKVDMTREEFEAQAEASGDAWREMDRLTVITGKLGEQYWDLDQETRNMQYSIDALNKSIGTHKKTVAELSEELDITEEAAQKMMDSMIETPAKAAQAVEKSVDVVKEASSKITKAVASGMAESMPEIEVTLKSVQDLIDLAFRQTVSNALAQSKEMSIAIQQEFGSMADDVLLSLSRARMGQPDQDTTEPVEAMSEKSIQLLQEQQRKALEQLAIYHRNIGTLESEEYVAEVDRLTTLYDSKIEVIQGKFARITDIIRNAMYEGREVTLEESLAIGDILSETTASMANEARRREAQIAAIMASGEGPDAIKEQGEQILSVLEGAHEDELAAIKDRTQKEVQELIGAYERGEIIEVNELQDRVARVRESESEQTRLAYDEHAARMKEYQAYWDAMGLTVDESTGRIVERTEEYMLAVEEQQAAWAKAQAERSAIQWSEIGEQAVSGLVSALEEHSSEAEAAAESIGDKIGHALSRGITSGQEDGKASVEQAAKELAESANKKFRDTLQIKSPSRVSYQDGAYYVEGLVNALEDGQSRVERASAGLAKSASLDIGGGAAGATHVSIENHFHGAVTQETVAQVESATDAGLSAALKRRGYRGRYL